MTAAEIERAAALAAFSVLPDDERAAVFAQLGEARGILAAADWRPAATSETHAAFQAATACVTAVYHRLSVPLSVVIEDQQPELVIWALSELLAQALRNFPESAVNDALRQWGALAVSGMQPPEERD